MCTLFYVSFKIKISLLHLQLIATRRGGPGPEPTGSCWDAGLATLPVLATGHNPPTPTKSWWGPAPRMLFCDLEVVFLSQVPWSRSPHFPLQPLQSSPYTVYALDWQKTESMGDLCLPGTAVWTDTQAMKTGPSTLPPCLWVVPPQCLLTQWKAFLCPQPGWSLHHHKAP